jgi:hypothetical protein
MPLQPLLDTVGRADIGLALLGALITVSAVVSLGQTWIEESFSTRRFDTAMKEVEPNQRAEIIRAMRESGRIGARGSEDDGAVQTRSLLARLLVKLLSRYRRHKD